MNPPTLQQEIQTARDAAGIILAFIENDLERIPLLLRSYGLSENLNAMLLLKGCGAFVYSLLNAVLEGPEDEISCENIAEILRGVLLDMAEAG